MCLDSSIKESNMTLNDIVKLEIVRGPVRGTSPFHLSHSI